MNQESTQNDKNNGLLIFAGTSLGNPADIPQRSLQALINANLLVFEEDRPARTALKAAGIHRPYLKLNEHGQDDTLRAVRSHLKEKKVVCYMSDQGMPNFADPGAQLLDIAYNLGCQVQVIPGPSSLTAALAACPFDITQFKYCGFLSRRDPALTHDLEHVAAQQTACVILEAPYRRAKLLAALDRILDPTRRILLALDISGPQEQYLVGTASQVSQKSDQIKDKLNFVIIIAKPCKNRR